MLLQAFLHHFIAIGQFKLELQSRNAKFDSKSTIFLPCYLVIWRMTLQNLNVEHDIITRDAYNVSWAEIFKFSKSQRDIINAVTISTIIVFEMICNVANYSGAKFTFPIEQPSNKAKCGIRRSWKLKMKPNHGCCSNIAITISYISVFVSSW